ncbi:MAG: type II toxin-antitoxin system RelE/ParE family toxin [Treponema sp.]|nr:type II toxin-antitoxin system RelE/ParE family toxin [Treponema sp.]
MGQGELQAFKKDAKYDFALTDEQIRAWLGKGSLIEML